jgi:hypothetical protein
MYHHATLMLQNLGVVNFSIWINVNGWDQFMVSQVDG